MISHGMVDEIKRLLAEGTHSQRRIARMTRVSRSTVGAIANGTRPEYALRAPAHDDRFDAPYNPPARCPGCGGRVFLPCRLCRVRRLKRIEAERRRRRKWLADYLSGHGVPQAVLSAAAAHENAACLAEAAE